MNIKPLLLEFCVRQIKELFGKLEILQSLAKNKDAAQRAMVALVYYWCEVKNVPVDTIKDFLCTFQQCVLTQFDDAAGSAKRQRVK